MAGLGLTPRFVLASASPARLEILRRAGLSVEVMVSGVDESTVADTNPASLALALAQLKCEAVAVGQPDALVLGCDSVLEFDGEIFGKPASPTSARDRWRRMRGRSGVLHTGHHLRLGGRTVSQAVATTVHFAMLTDGEVDAYIDSGEPLHVAGAFTIDGRGGAFIERIEGDHNNVIGLSLPALRQMLAELGLRIDQFWD